MKQICAALNAPNFDEDIMEEFCPSNQALASALKQFFRDLGSPILGKLMDNSKIAKVEQEKQQNERFYQIAELLDGLDEYERYNLAYLCRFCREVKEHQKVWLRCISVHFDGGRVFHFGMTCVRLRPSCVTKLLLPGLFHVSWVKIF